MSELSEAMERCRCWQHYRDIGAQMVETDELKDAMVLYHRVAHLEAALREWINRHYCFHSVTEPGCIGCKTRNLLWSTAETKAEPEPDEFAFTKIDPPKKWSRE